MIEMVDMNPPLSEFHPLRALYLIPSSPPPTPQNAKKFSKEFLDFLQYCLVKEANKRPTAKEMLRHRFVQPSYHTKKASSKKRRDTFANVIERVGKGLDMSE